MENWTTEWIFIIAAIIAIIAVYVKRDKVKGIFGGGGKGSNGDKKSN